LVETLITETGNNHNSKLRHLDARISIRYAAFLQGIDCLYPPRRLRLQLWIKLLTRYFSLPSRFFSLLTCYFSLLPVTSRYFTF